MLRKPTWLAGALLLALHASPLTAAAQSDSRLADARQAYAAVGYEGTRAHARAAIERGGNHQASTGAPYFLWALAAAALDRADEARSAFNYALAVNPQLKVDRSLSPKIRAPYLEARGALTRADGKPPLEVTARRRGRRLGLSVVDTLGLVETVALATRAQHAGAFSRQRFAPSPTRSVEVSAERLEFFALLLDRHGNSLRELGNEGSPEALPAAPPPPSEPPAPPSSAAADAARAPYYVTAAALGALGLLAGGVSTALFLKREDAAKEWNGPGCEKAGATRAAQCAKVDERRRDAEHSSIGFAAAGGALLVGGVVTWLLAPSSKRTSVSVETTSHAVVFGLRTPL